MAEKPKPKRTRKKKVEPVAEEAAVEAAPAVTEVAAAPAEAAPASEAVTADPAAEAESDENGEPRRGWWQRTFGQ